MWSKIKSFFTSMPLELTPDKETKMIENIAKRISQQRMELPALLFIEPFEPISSIVAETFLVWISPVLDLAGLNGYEYSLLLRKKENVRRIRERIEELRKEKEEKR
jgi:hypothetical protein